MISGQLLPTTGSVLVNGLQPISVAAKKLVGIAPQSLALYEEFSAQDNLEFFGRIYGLKGSALKAACQRVLEFVELEGRAKDRVEHYSGGMKRSNSTTEGISEALMPLKLVQEDVVVQKEGPANAYSITMPQAMFWAIIGCGYGIRSGAGAGKSKRHHDTPGRGTD